ncbi:MAG: DUF1318 domain-containing protein [Methyloprofundus sp.]|nr:DUF1318 domain-containing protein [Methyloprofundus sp.]
MKRLSVASVLLLTACVTINIYFPAAATEKVADEIIQGIQQEEEKDQSSNQLPALLPQWQVSLYRVVDNTLSIFIASAHAEANLSVNNSEIRQIRARMKARFSSLAPYYRSGLIAINSNGLLSSRGQAPLKERNTIKKLITAENADRNNLYQAIANANGHPEWHAQIKATFSRSWVKHAQSGWWYQDGATWKQK